VLPAPKFLTIFCANRALATVLYTFCRPHLPKVFRAGEFFEHVEVATKLSLQSRARFADLIFPKALRARQFFLTL